MSHPRIQCLVFDFDGTLADTLEVSLRIYNRLAPTYNLRTIAPDELAAVRAMTMNEFIRFTGVSRMRIPRILAAGKRIVSAFMHTVKPFDGLPEVLPTLRAQFPTLGIITSNSKENVQAFLKANMMEHFDFISSVPKLTGKAAHLKAVEKIFTVSPREIAYIGDETRDIKAARKAGVVSLAAGWGFNSCTTLREFTPDLLLESPLELAELYNRLEARNQEGDVAPVIPKEETSWFLSGKFSTARKHA